MSTELVLNSESDRQRKKHRLARQGRVPLYRVAGVLSQTNEQWGNCKSWGECWQLPGKFLKVQSLSGKITYCLGSLGTPRDTPLIPGSLWTFEGPWKLWGQLDRMVSLLPQSPQGASGIHRDPQGCLGIWKVSLGITRLPRQKGVFWGMNKWGETNVCIASTRGQVWHSKL